MAMTDKCLDLIEAALPGPEDKPLRAGLVGERAGYSSTHAREALATLVKQGRAIFVGGDTKRRYRRPA